MILKEFMRGLIDMFKVILKFTNNKIKEIESIELSTFEEAQRVAVEGKYFYNANNYDIIEVEE